MFLFRLLDFVLRVLGTIFIVLMLQIPLGGKTLEEHLLQFLRNKENVQPLRQVAQKGQKKVKKELLGFVQKKLDHMEKTRDIAQVSQDENTIQESVTQESATQENENLEQQIILLKNKYFSKLTSLLSKSGFISKLLPQVNSSVEALQKQGVSDSLEENLEEVQETLEDAQ